MTEKRKIVFVVNPISGTLSKKNIPTLIHQTMDSERWEWKILETAYAGHAAVIAREQAEAGTDVVVAVGGDGTVNEVARALTHSQTALGIIPCGSGNGLARHLGIPMDAKRAIEILNTGVVEDFDYGIINGQPFFCTCGMGFDAFVSLKFAEAGKRGLVTYAENVLKEGLKYQPETYEVVSDGGLQRHKAFLIACANASQYGNNAYIAPGATMKDGEMDVIIMEPFDVFEAPQIAADLFMKTLPSHSKIKTFRTKQLTIHRREPGAIHFDGDPMMTDSDVEISIEHLGIRIVTNPEAQEDEGQPNLVLNAFSDFFNNINNVREDIRERGHRIQVISKLMLRRLSKG